MFPNRKLVPVEGDNSDCVLHSGYLPENDNPALATFLAFIEEQHENPSYQR